MTKRDAARTKLREYFVANVGKVIKSKTLQEVAGISDYQRRIRELRRDEGYRIRTHRDRSELKTDEYVLESLERDPVAVGGIDAATRVLVLRRDGYTCQVCGAGAGEPHPTDPRKKTRLQVDHIVPRSEGGTNDADNLRTLCSVCNEGRSNLELPTSERAINVLEIVRRSPRDVQVEVLAFLKRKFGEQ